MGINAGNEVANFIMHYKIGVNCVRSLYFAGLYETWMSLDNIPTKTCAIITTEPYELIKTIHDRMPVIVSKDKEGIWIDAGIQDQKKLLSILVPYPSDEMKISEGFIPMP